MKQLFAIAVLVFLAAAFVPRLLATSVTLHAFDSTSGVSTPNVGSVSIVNDGTMEVMQGTSTTIDPQIILANIDSTDSEVFDTAVFTQIQITIYIDAGSTTSLSVYYATTDAPGFSGTRVVNVDTSAYRGQYHTYTIDMTGQPGWTGTLTDLRIDPFAQSGKTFKIDQVNLLSTAGDFTALNPTVMDILWRVNVSSIDRMTTHSTSERGASPCDGQILYVPAATNSFLQVLNRFRRPTPSDHRDAGLSAPPGYTLEGAMGYPWAAAHTGLDPIYEATNVHGDNATVNPRFDSLLDNGYALNGNQNGYGYARYDNSYAGVSLTTLTAGGVTVSSNKVAGGAIWEWSWNGMQFINDWDYGRQMQSALYFPYTYSGTAYGANPTEGGANAAGNAAGGSGQNLFSSVNLVSFNVGNTQVTRSIPMEWNGATFGGNASNNPVLWTGLTMGKDVTLNYRGMGHVAKYVTTVHTPVALASADPLTLHMELPTIYARSVFSSLYSYNAVTGVLTSQTLAAYPPAPTPPAVYYNVVTLDYGGVIAATPDSTYAIGLYGVYIHDGGSVSNLSLWNFAGYGGSGGQYDQGCVKLGVNWGATSLAAGDNVWTCYVVTGTLSDVTTAMQTLYTMRASIPK